MGAALYNAIVDAVVAVYSRAWGKVYGPNSYNRYIIGDFGVLQVVDEAFVKCRRVVCSFVARRWEEMKANSNKVLYLSKKVYMTKRVKERVKIRVRYR